MANDNIKQLNKAKATAKSGFFQRMSAQFGWGIKKADKNRGNNQGNLEIKFIDYKPTMKDKEYKSKNAQLQDIKRALADGNLSESSREKLEQWLAGTMCSYDDIKDREERINLIDEMCYNAPFASNAVELMAGEAVGGQTDEIIEVISEDIAWAQKTTNLVNKAWNLKKGNLFVIARDITKSGEAVLGNSVNSNGILKTHVLRPLEIQERLEFNPQNINEFNGQGGGTSPYGKNNQANFKSREELLTSFESWATEDALDDDFKTYLFGFRSVDDKLYYPWQIIHFRYNLEGSEFKPYGRPMLLDALGPYSAAQLEYGLNSFRKYLSLPRTNMKVNCKGLNESRAWEHVNNVREKYENSSLASEFALDGLPSINLKMWTSDELVTEEIITPDGSNNQDDSNMLKHFDDRIAQATGVPKQYIDVTSEGFQMSGVALSQLFLPFQRKVDSIRDVITQTISDAINLHYAIRGEKCPEFAVVLKVSSKIGSEQMRGAMEIMDAVLGKVALLLGAQNPAELPLEIVKDVMIKYTPITDDEIDSWLNLSKVAKPRKPAAGAEGAEGGMGGDEGFMPGGDMGGGGMGDLDLGAPVDMGGGDAPDIGAPAPGVSLESRFNHGSKKRLNELKKRYYSFNETSLFMKLVEATGSLKTSKGYALYGNDIHDEKNEDLIRFFREANPYGSKQHMQG